MKTTYFDLILIYTSHRRHNNYLNIIKYLSKYKSIGLLGFEEKHEWGKTEEEYWQCCLDSGAEIITGNVECHDVMISRFGKGKTRGYYEYILEDMPNQVKYERVLLNVDSLMQGFPYLEDVIQNLGKPILLVPSIKLFGLTEPHWNPPASLDNITMVEVGTPYKKYPYFENFNTDYLLAYPSHCSVNDPWHELHLLKNIVKTLRKMPNSAEVVVKTHNVRDDGNRLSYRSRFLIKFPFWLIDLSIFFLSLIDLRIGKKTFLERLSNKALHHLILLHNEYIFRRCKNLLNTHPAFGFEHFAAGVNKGLITGLSQTISNAVFQKVPVCICDDLSIDQKPKTYQIMSQFFDFSKWKDFSRKGFDKFDEKMRNADLIEFLKK